jgi:hypothetical protein
VWQAYLRSMLKLPLLILLFTLSLPVWAGTIANLTSGSRVRILKVVENFETGIIEEMRRGKVVESCMKIADAYNASIELQTLMKKDLYQLTGGFLTLKTDCANLDLVKLDELYLNQMSRHLILARESFQKI